MDIVYTLHADEQIKERKIHKIWVEESIKAPDETKHEGNKHYVTKKLNGKTLKVVYVKGVVAKFTEKHNALLFSILKINPCF